MIYSLRPCGSTPDEIQYISRKIVKTLVGEGKLEVDSEPRVVERIDKVITDELRSRTDSTRRSARS